MAVRSELLKVKIQTPLVTCPWEGGARRTEYVHTRRYICISSDVLAFRALGIIVSSFCLIQDVSREKVLYVEFKSSVYFENVGRGWRSSHRSYEASKSFGLCEHQPLLQLSSVHKYVTVPGTELCT